MSSEQLEWESEGFKAFTDGSKCPNFGFGAKAYYWRRGWHDAYLLDLNDKDDKAKKK